MKMRSTSIAAFLLILCFSTIYAKALLQFPAQRQSERGGEVRTINGVAVPSDFPVIETHQYGKTAPGKIFFASTFGTLGNYIIILENDGTPYFYRKYPGYTSFYNASSGDFKMQPTGVLTAFLYIPNHYIVLDHNYVEIDTFKCQNCSTNSHDLVLLQNGHALLIGGEILTVDLSQWGGSTNARISSSFIQELDENKNVFWEWHPFEPNRFKITDAIHEDLTQGNILVPQINSVAVDYDDHIIISSRCLDEVTKINHETGDIIWRLGGVNNQFEFINENYQFTYQHHARPVPNKPNHYTIYDNGNYRNPDSTRAVEYKIDTTNSTAQKVWEFWIPYTTEINRVMMGSVQRLPNGNTYIDWCEWPPLQGCEVDSNNQIVFDITVEGTSSYRSKRYEWEGMTLVPYLIAESYFNGINLIFNKFGDPNVDHYNIYGDTLPNPTALLATSDETYIVLSNLQNHTDWYFRVTSVNQYGNESDYSNEEKVFTSFTESAENCVRNGDFSNGKNHWTLWMDQSGGASATGEIDSNEQYHVQIDNGGSAEWHIQLFQTNLGLINGRTYRFEFDAYADENRIFQATVMKNSAPWTNYAELGDTYLTTQKQHFAYEFIMQHATDSDALINFACGQSDIDIYLDNVFLKDVTGTNVDHLASLPEIYRLDNNYPNPFNWSTWISFTIPRDEKVSLKIYDLLGREVKTLVNGHKKVGSYQVSFDGTNLPSGIYIYRLETPSFLKTRKMILMK